MSYPSLIGAFVAGEKQAFEMLWDAFNKDLKPGLTVLEKWKKTCDESGGVLLEEIPAGEEGKYVLRCSAYNVPRAIIGMKLDISFVACSSNGNEYVFMVSGYKTEAEMLGLFKKEFPHHALNMGCKTYSDGLTYLRETVQAGQLNPVVSPGSTLGQQLIRLCGFLGMSGHTASHLKVSTVGIYNCCGVVITEPKPPKPYGKGDDAENQIVGDPGEEDSRLRELVYRKGLTLVTQIQHQSGDIAFADC
jgi:hypothetical protein